MNVCTAEELEVELVIPSGDTVIVRAPKTGQLSVLVDNRTTVASGTKLVTFDETDELIEQRRLNVLLSNVRRRREVLLNLYDPAKGGMPAMGVVNAGVETGVSTIQLSDEAAKIFRFMEENGFAEVYQVTEAEFVAERARAQLSVSQLERFEVEHSFDVAHRQALILERFYTKLIQRSQASLRALSVKAPKKVMVIHERIGATFAKQGDVVLRLEAA